MLGALLEEGKNPFQAQLPFQIDETIKDLPEQETELSVSSHKRKKKRRKNALGFLGASLLCKPPIFSTDLK